MVFVSTTMNPLSPLSLLFVSLLLSCTGSIILGNGRVIKDGLAGFQKIDLPGVIGPESLAFDCHGEGPYASVSDGRVLKWNASSKAWKEFAITSPNRDRKACDGSTDPNKEAMCGRPLGIKFDSKTCNLYFVDAYFGLYVVGPSGGVAKQLAVSADDGVRFNFLNGLDVDSQTGVVYFSDSSTVFPLRDWPKIIGSKDKTGRVLKYDPSTKKAHVLLKGFPFPNGVALSKDGSFLVIAGSSTNNIFKYWLQGPKANTSEIFIKLPKGPDNIKRNKDGSFWVGINADRDILKASLGNEFAGMAFSDPVGMKFDENGKIIDVLEGGGGPELDSVSEVLEEHNGLLWIGSVVKPYVGIVKRS